MNKILTLILPFLIGFTFPARAMLSNFAKKVNEHANTLQNCHNQPVIDQLEQQELKTLQNCNNNQPATLHLSDLPPGLKSELAQYLPFQHAEFDHTFINRSRNKTNNFFDLTKSYRITFPEKEDSCLLFFPQYEKLVKTPYDKYRDKYDTTKATKYFGDFDPIKPVGIICPEKGMKLLILTTKTDILNTLFANAIVNNAPVTSYPLEGFVIINIQTNEKTHFNFPKDLLTILPQETNPFSAGAYSSDSSMASFASKDSIYLITIPSNSQQSLSWKKIKNFSHTLTVKKLEFNIQSNKLIAFYSDQSYELFPLHDKQSDLTLGKYFRENFICKNFEGENRFNLD